MAVEFKTEQRKVMFLVWLGKKLAELVPDAGSFPKGVGFAPDYISSIHTYMPDTRKTDQLGQFVRDLADRLPKPGYRYYTKDLFLLPQPTISKEAFELRIPFTREDHSEAIVNGGGS